MRNWNVETVDRSGAEPPLASRLPMRNWNQVRSPLLPLLSSFQTTYEELKLDLIVEGGILYGFQTTYEELKQPFINYERQRGDRLPDYLWGIETLDTGIDGRIIHRRLPDYLWGIETSWMQGQVLRSRLASRLPMRNWNLRRALEVETKVWGLPDYLWGIETAKYLAQLQRITRLPDYLWGIETRSTRATRTIQGASRLPMRNWNSSSLDGFPPSSSGFQTTYEELKHKLANDFALTPAALPDYLWGIETTWWHRRRPDSRESFQTTYEELKH